MSLAIVVVVAFVSILIGLVSLYYLFSSSSRKTKMSAEAHTPAPVAEVPEQHQQPSAPADPPAEEQRTATSAAPKNKANSYYYWHGHEKERAKLGDVAPLPTPHLVSKDDTVAVTIPVVPTISVSKYSWCDGEKFVSVYVECTPPGSGEVLEETSITSAFTRNSFKVSFTTTDANGKQRTKQMVTRLSKRIDAARSSTKVKPKTQEILVRLAKRVPSVWIDLEGNASDRDSAADEPLEKPEEGEEKE